MPKLIFFRTLKIGLKCEKDFQRLDWINP